jgi:putative transposase
MKIRLPKLGWLRFFDSRPLAGTPKSVTVSIEVDGIYVSVLDETDGPPPGPAVGDSVGIDMGIVHFATLSDGTHVDIPPETVAEIRRLERRGLHLQREAARKYEAARRRAEAEHKVRKGRGKPRVPVSNRLRRLYRRIALVDRRKAAVMRDFRRKASTAISRNRAIVFAKYLKTGGMNGSAAGTVEEPGRNVRQKSGLNRSILRQGWGEFLGTLGWKLAERGGELVRVDPRNTGRRCPACGHTEKGNRPGQAEFRCLECGYGNNADVVGAMNVLAAGHAASMHGEVRAPEARRRSVSPAKGPGESRARSGIPLF